MVVNWANDKWQLVPKEIGNLELAITAIVDHNRSND